MNYVLSPAAVAKLRRLLGGVLGNALTPSASPATVSPDDFPAPYTVRYAASLNSGSGGWIIWLPSASLLYVNGAAVDVRSGLSAAGNGYPSGWYSLGNVLSSTGGTVYLAVTTGSSTSATFTNTPSGADYAVLIATATRSTSTLAVQVAQSVTSALSVGGGGSISASGIVVMSVDYVTSSGDPDFATHPYAIRIKRGTLSNVNGEIKPVEDVNLKQFIDTIEHSAAMDQS